MPRGKRTSIFVIHQGRGPDILLQAGLRHQFLQPRLVVVNDIDRNKHRDGQNVRLGAQVKKREREALKLFCLHPRSVAVDAMRGRVYALDESRCQLAARQEHLGAQEDGQSAFFQGLKASRGLAFARRGVAERVGP